MSEKRKGSGFTKEELRSIFGLSSVLLFRMLGLSMIIPVFAVYAVDLPGATPMLAGIAFGVYGLTQALLQIPFGYLSDRLGRKPVIVTGLLIFGVGSVFAAITTNIYLLIAARFLQGAGAIASASFAWIADLTRPEKRNMAMAFMGIAIGGGIVLGMIIGPPLGALLGVPALFWLAAGLSVAAIIIVVTRLKEPTSQAARKELTFSLDPRKGFSYVAVPDLIKLDVAGFMINTSMIAIFFAIPLRLAAWYPMGELWKIYLALGFLGGVAMMLSSRRADAGSQSLVTAGAATVVALACFVFFMTSGKWGTLAGFALFFAAFSVLEAVLPAAVSKKADPVHKGSVIGAFNLSVFLGTFAGGLLAGWLVKESPDLLFALLCGANLLVAAITMTIRESAPAPDEAVPTTD